MKIQASVVKKSEIMRDENWHYLCLIAFDEAWNSPYNILDTIETGLLGDLLRYELLCVQRIMRED